MERLKEKTKNAQHTTSSTIWIFSGDGSIFLFYSKSFFVVLKKTVISPLPELVTPLCHCGTRTDFIITENLVKSDFHYHLNR